MASTMTAIVLWGALVSALPHARVEVAIDTDVEINIDTPTAVEGTTIDCNAAAIVHHQREWDRAHAMRFDLTEDERFRRGGSSTFSLPRAGAPL